MNLAGLNDGNIDGAFLVHLPERDFALAILANTAGGAQRLLMSLGGEILKERADATPVYAAAVRSADCSASPAKDLAAYCGLYTNHTRALIELDGDRLVITVTAKETNSDQTASQAFSLRPIRGNRFLATGRGAEEADVPVEFLFQAESKLASHLTLPGGRVFARYDAMGQTGIHPA